MYKKAEIYKLKPRQSIISQMEHYKKVRQGQKELDATRLLCLAMRVERAETGIYIPMLDNNLSIKAEVL